jgi:multidrug efflux system membrane fusion protein
MRVNAASAKGALAVDVFGNDGVTVVDSGKLTGIDNQVDPTTGTLKLKAEFPNGGFQLWPGQFVNVRLKVETISQALVVPTSAVQRGPVGAFSYVIGDGDIVAAKPVTVTQQNETQAVIGSGLAAGDRVVTTGFANLSDGAKVIVGKDEQAPSADLAPRKKGSRGPQAKDSPKDGPTKDGAASDSSGKDGQGKDGERRKRRSQSEGDASGGGAKAQP